MAGWDDIRNKFAEIQLEWDEAERVIKIAEQVNSKVTFPSIKELRYAGRRLIEAMSCAEKAEYSKAMELLQDATFDCHRARHDAIDAATSKITLDFDAAAEEIGFKPILDVFPEFSKARTILNGIRAKIADSREDRENRSKIYASIEGEEFIALSNYYFEFLANEDVMKEFAKKDRRKQTLSYAMAAVGFISMCVAVLAFILS